MRRLVTGMTISRGFTLIEILIVIVIIGITVGFALLAFGDFGESRSIQFAAEQLANTLRLTQQQAILETSTFGLRIDNNQYQILKFQTSSWQAPSNQSIFKIHYFPKHTLITLKTANKAATGTPSIVINPSGEMTPFTLGFATNKESLITTLVGHHDGSLTFDVAKTK